MTRAAKPSRADQLRRHREIFTYARAHDLTLIEAEKALVHAEWLAAQERLARLRACGTSTRSARTEEERTALRQAQDGRGLGEGLRPIPADAPWMMRD